MKRAFRALFGEPAQLRWIHLILGGALLMPYWLLAGVVLAPLIGGDGMFYGSLAQQFGAYAAALPMAAASGLLSLARPTSVAVARVLCGVPAERYADGPAHSWAARLRSSGWFTLHVGLGGLVSGASLALPPFAVTTMLLPLPAVRDWARLPEGLQQTWVLALAPFAGLAMLLALAACAAAAGALLAGRAPVLLGPTPEDRLAAAERRATELAERNRLARELHDSVGHALSAVTLQAGAARKVLHSDVEFVREALTAIEETARRTVGELDSVLGLLRQDADLADLADAAGASATGPDLAGLDGLLSRSGVKTSLAAEGDLAAVPRAVSREAYRIVQEGLSNALRHAGASPVSLWIALRGEELEITMENPLPSRAPAVRPGGGRGLRGVAERAALLGGRAQAGPDGAVWRLSARLPLGGRR
ncbi:histidine kinase [Streptomyces sp. NPDC051907]|uniref:sensor histidine kinase n=1 Tax=Streptomyces sp. NPDC051907 TaxID=3155284 RepID=UPI00342F041A